MKGPFTEGTNVPVDGTKMSFLVNNLQAPVVPVAAGMNTPVVGLNTPVVECTKAPAETGGGVNVEPAIGVRCTCRGGGNAHPGALIKSKASKEPTTDRPSRD